MAEDGLEGYLERLKGAGELDSDGNFTLNIQKALERLEQLSLADPGGFYRNLVSAAVTSGASHIRLETRGGGFDLEHDGQPLNRKRMEEIFSSPLLKNSQEHLRELAFGLQAARRLGFERFCLSSRGPDGGSVMNLQPGGIEIQSLPPGETSTRIELPRPRTLLRLPFSRAGIEIQTEDLQWSPVSIEVNGELLQPPLENCLTVVTIQGEQSLPSIPPLASHMRCARHPGAWSAWLMLGTEASDFVLVIHGIAYHVEAGSPYPNLTVVVHDPKARKDASLNQVVWDERQEQLQDQIRAYCDEAVVELASRVRREAQVSATRQMLEGRLRDLNSDERLEWLRRLGSARLLEGAGNRLFTPLQALQELRERGYVGKKVKSVRSWIASSPGSRSLLNGLAWPRFRCRTAPLSSPQSRQIQGGS